MSQPTATTETTSTNNNNNNRNSNSNSSFDAHVLYHFHAEEDDELTVKKGDMVVVKQVFDDGWSLCESLSTKRTGLIPSKYYEKTELASIEPKREKIPVRKGSVKQLQVKLNLDQILGIPSPVVTNSPSPQSKSPRNSRRESTTPTSPSPTSPSEEFKPKPKLAKTDDIKLMQEKRKQIRVEILTTEQTYLHCLTLLRNNFAEPVKKLKLLSDETYRLIFPNAINVIYEINSSFLEYLQKIISGNSSMALSADVMQQLLNGGGDVSPTTTPHDTEKVRKSFEIDPLQSQSTQLAGLILHFAHSFKLYTDYINKYPTIIGTLLQEKAKNKKFASFLQDQRKILREKKERCCTLEDLAITPVQRLPRYRLLFEDLMKHTESIHESHTKLKQAVELVSVIAKFCNDKEEEYGNINALNIILKKFKLKDFLHSSRKLIMKFEDQTEIRYVRSGGATVADCDLYILSDVLIMSKKKLSIGKSRPVIQYLQKNVATQNKGHVLDVKATVDRLTIDQQPYFSLVVQTSYSGDNNKSASVQKTTLVSRSEESINKLYNVIQPPTAV